MNDQLLDVVRQKLGDALHSPMPRSIPRELDTATIPGKVRAVIGMRRAGKTMFLKQCLAARLNLGAARERLVYFNFEDERLAGVEAKHLGVVLDEYYRAHPALRHRHRVTFCFDEIQTVTGWEKFVRRILDSEEIEVLISGSSAKMLSREVASSMRGRALETVVTPFSFREFGTAAGLAPDHSALRDSSEVSAWTSCFDDYLRVGGFPELSDPDLRSRQVELLQGYAEAVVFRDVAERHAVSNLHALRAFVRQLLRQPSRMLSITRVHADFRSRGISVAKAALLEWLGHLNDAFLLFTVPIATRSERKSQVNLRKLYAVDHGLAAAFRARSAQDLGQDLENIVACELQRRGCELAYVRTASGREVDFLATTRTGERHLVQVAARAFDPTTLGRELSALAEAAQEHRGARQWLLLGEALAAGTELPKAVTAMTVWRWCLENQWMC